MARPPLPTCVIQPFEIQLAAGEGLEVVHDPFWAFFGGDDDVDVIAANVGREQIPIAVVAAVADGLKDEVSSCVIHQVGFLLHLCSFVRRECASGFDYRCSRCIAVPVD